MMNLSSTAFMAWNRYCFTHLFSVLIRFNILELQSHVCKCMILWRCAHGLLPYMCSRGRDLPSDSALCVSRGGGGLLDLSCQPFTHNVSFMNASCADLIPFTAGQKHHCAHANTPEQPADPLHILIPQQGWRGGPTKGNRATIWPLGWPARARMKAQDHPIFCFSQTYTVSHRDRNRNSLERALSQKEITLLSVADVIKADA